MRKQNQIKIWSFLLMIVLLSSYGTAVQTTETQVQQVDTPDQIVIGATDVITASDAGGGYLSSRDLILIIAIGVVILVLVAL
jgi:hypothetical protein